MAVSLSANSVIVMQKFREIDGKIRTLIIKRDALGYIYIYFVCETTENKVLTRTGKSVGFDFGLKRLR